MIVQIGVEPFTDENTTDAEWAKLLRDYRGMLLASSDWTTLADNQLTAEKKTEWQAYRQVLRDLPATAELGLLVEFPDPPS